MAEGRERRGGGLPAQGPIQSSQVPPETPELTAARELLVPAPTPQASTAGQCLYDQACNIDNPAPANADAGELLSMSLNVTADISNVHLVLHANTKERVTSAHMD